MANDECIPFIVKEKFVKFISENTFLALGGTESQWLEAADVFHSTGEPVECELIPA